MCLKRRKSRNIPNGSRFLDGISFRNLRPKEKRTKAVLTRTLSRAAEVAIDKFMKDIIAGRPIFGGPQQPGGFRLRYGRGRPSGLAAASLNPASMLVLDDFITIGTQMKIERPGKACAVTPSNDSEGPWVVLSSGQFLRIDESEHLRKIHGDIRSIWDNGEIVIGYGEFMENNKNLVPAGYTTDWWASDLIDALETEEDVKAFSEICKGLVKFQTEFQDRSTSKTVLPSSMFDDVGTDTFRNSPSVGTKHQALQSVGEQHLHLRTIHGSSIYQSNGFQPYWMLFLVASSKHRPTSMLRSTTLTWKILGCVSRRCERLAGISDGQVATRIDTSLDEMETIGLDVKPEEPIFDDELPEGWTFMQHGLLKEPCFCSAFRTIMMETIS